MKLLHQILGPLLALLLTFGSVVEVSAPVTVAAAGVVLGVGHAQAATPAQKVVVLNSVPGWVLRASGALPSIDMDFAHNRAWVGGSGPRAPPSLLTTTRASTGYAQWADGHLSSFGSNIPRITDLGLLVEQAATCLALWNRDLTNANWTKSNVTAALDQTGMDGGANTASSLTATSTNGTVTAAAITSASASRTVTMGVKRITGSGAVSISQDGGSTFTAITTKVGAAWYIPTPTDFAGLTQTVTNPQIVIKLGTSGDKIAVDFVDLEAGAFNTSPIATTTVAVTRAADAIVLTNGTFPDTISIFASAILGNITSTSGLVGWGTTSPNRAILASSSASPLFGNDSAGFNIVPSGAFVVGSIGKVAARNQSGSFAVTFNGGTMATSALTGGPSPITKVTVGRNVDNGQFLNGYLRRLAIFNSALSNAQLQALTQ